VIQQIVVAEHGERIAGGVMDEVADILEDAGEGLSVRSRTSASSWPAMSQAAELAKRDQLMIPRRGSAGQVRDDRESRP
jgi:hypothetical protein